MHELERINTLLGGHDITVKGIRKLAGGKGNLHVCEIGCGGGDNLRAIAGKRKDLRFTGIDLKPECIRYAKEGWPAGLPAEWIVSDYRNVVFPDKPDVIFSSLFCHHFDDEGVVEILRWCAANSRLGFFLNDLHRHPLAYHSIRLLTKAFSGSYLVKHDAPLSVARGFSRSDLLRYSDDAGLESRFGMRVDIQWNWAFRWLLTARHA